MTTLASPPARTAPAAPAAATGSRRRWRRRLLLIGVLPLVAALLLTLKVAVMLTYNQAGRDQLARGDLEAAAGSFGSSGLVNVLEPWVAPYDLGTTDYLQGEYADARRHLEQALADVPGDEECRVRINLALTHEALGDAARADGAVGRAREAWATGRAVLAGGDCLSSDTRTADPDVAAAVTATEERLARKLTETTEEVDREQQADRERDASLRDRNERAEEVRREQQERRDRPPRPDDSEEEAPPPPVYQW